MTGSLPSALAVAHVTYSWPEAEVLCCALNAAGIRAYLPDRHTVGFHSYASIAFGGFRILIDADKEDAASEIIAEFKSAESDNPTPDSTAFRENLPQSLFWLYVSLFWNYCPAWMRRRR